MVERTFLPAAGLDWLLPLYDPLWRLSRGESHLEAFVGRADVQPGDRVLDIGCGTGNLTLLTKRLCPEAEVVGLDPDAKALARARSKAERGGLRVQLDQGFSQELPYGDDSFDRVFSSFMFHHLDRETKTAMLRETRRVLRPRGSFHLVDFGGHAPGALGRFFRAAHGLENDAEDKVLTLMRQAGFEDSEDVEKRAMRLVGITFYRAG